MKLSKRLLFLVFSLVMSFSVLLQSVNASNILPLSVSNNDILNGKVAFSYQLTRGANKQLLYSSDFYLINEPFKDSGEYKNYVSTNVTGAGSVFHNVYSLTGVDENGAIVLVSKNDSFEINIKNIMLYADIHLYSSTSSNVQTFMPYYLNFENFAFYKIYLYDVNGQEIVLDSRYDDTFNVNTSDNEKYHNITVKCDNSPVDIVDFSIEFHYLYNKMCPWYSDTSSVTYGLYPSVNDKTSVTINVSSEEVGKLNSIIDNIKQIPEKIINGFKSLFVPSEEELSNYSDKWDKLLSNRFGAIYQVSQVLKDYGSELLNSIKNAKTREYIEVPIVEIPLLNDNKFTFGGWKISLKIDELETVYTFTQSLTGFIATLLFIGGLRKRYDEVMGVES